MKKLIVSLKSSSEALDGFAQAFRSVKKRAFRGTHREISFDRKKDFDRFVRNLGLLSQILMFRPKSVYDLAKISRMDVSNLNKIILFFEEVGAIRIRKTTLGGRAISTPVVDYQQIEFDLRVA
jgi:predicted transcriptional regulator